MQRSIRMSNITAGSVYQVIPTEISTDFTGFTFKGVHSSEFNIVRVSMGSRYSDSLLPTHNDKTAQVPGANGTYYFGTDYTQRNFPLNIAFDSVTEQDIRKMRQLFGVNEIGILTFDEAPYKEYTVKASDTINLQYICFGEIGTERIYKGEGTMQLVAYYPFAICRKKYLSEYDNSNIDEWKNTAGLLAEQGTYDTDVDGSIKLYNPGDLETDFQAYYAFNDDGIINLKSIYLSESAKTLKQATFNFPFTKKGKDAYIRIDSETELIEGCDADMNTTGNLYNEYIHTGELFKIPLIDSAREVNFISDGTTCAKFVYNYIYI